MAAREVDIGDGCSSMEGVHQDLPEGHSVQDVMQNTNPFSRDEIRYFERKFDFDCPEMPTKFYFRITFPRCRSHEIMSVASVRRTDQSAGLVNVTLVVMVCGSDGREAFASYTIPDLGPGKVLSNTRRIPFETSQWSWLAERNPRLEFSVTVLGCHVEQKGAKARDTPHSSKKRLSVQSSS